MPYIEYTKKGDIIRDDIKDETCLSLFFDNFVKNQRQLQIKEEKS